MEAFEAKNFCQYRQVRVEFHPGVTGIVGPNGAGKSNLISGIHLALMNESLAAGVKEDDVSQLAVAGESSYAQVSLRLREKRVTLRRELAPSTKHRLEVEGQEPVIKADRIALALDQLLGFPADLLSRFLFSRQGELFDLLLQTPLQRAKTFQSLLGMEDVEAVYNDLGKEAASVPGDAPDLVPIRLIAAEVKEVDAKLTESNQQKSELEARLLLEDQRQAREKAIAAASQRQLLDSQIATRQKELAQARQDLASAQSEEANTSAKLATVRRDLEAIADEVTAAAHWQETQVAREQRQREIAAIRKEISDWQKELDRVSALPGEEAGEKADVLLAEISSLQTRYGTVCGYLEQRATPAAATCPTCQQPWSLGAERAEKVKQWQAEKAALVARIGEAKAERSLLIESHSKAVARQKRQQEAAAAIAAKTQLLDQLRRQAKEAGDGEEGASEVDVEKAHRLLDKDRHLRAEESKLQEMLTGRIAKKVASASTSLQHHQKTLDRSRAQWDQLNEEASRFDQPQKDLDQDQRFRQEVAGLARDIANLKERKEGLRVRFRAETKKFEAAQRAKSWKTKVSAWREACHPQAVPRMLVVRVLRQLLERSIPEILQSFQSPFQVVLDEPNLSFVAIFSDGRRQPARRLSGGQRSILAFAVRLAICQWAASDLGVLILDEPTEGLDADNTKLFRDAVAAVRSSAVERGLQLIVVTHAEEVASVCDRTIEVQPGGRVVAR